MMFKYTLSLAAAAMCLITITVSGFQDKMPRYMQKKNLILGPDDEVRVCGRQLDEMLEILCNGMFNEYVYPQVKRRISGPGLGARPKAQRTLMGILSGNSLDANVPVSLHNALYDGESLDSHIRVSRGVVDECCKQSCKVRHLKLYCAYDEDDVTGEMYKNMMSYVKAVGPENA